MDRSLVNALRRTSDDLERVANLLLQSAAQIRAFVEEQRRNEMVADVVRAVLADNLLHNGGLSDSSDESTDDNDENGSGEAMAETESVASDSDTESSTSTLDAHFSSDAFNGYDMSAEDTEYDSDFSEWSMDSDF